MFQGDGLTMVFAERLPQGGFDLPMEARLADYTGAGQGQIRGSLEPVSDRKGHFRGRKLACFGRYPNLSQAHTITPYGCTSKGLGVSHLAVENGIGAL